MTLVAPDGDRLLGVIRDLSLSVDLQQVMDIVRREARALSGADGVTFVLREGDQCYYAEEDAIGPLWKGRRFPMSICISGWVMRNKQPVAIGDIYEDERIPIDAYRPTFVNSLAMVPVRRDDPVGAIGAYWAARYLPTPDDLGLLQSIADAAALALANVQLYGDLQRALAREQEARRQAEAASRAKDEWIGVISHELRTPLMPILGWTQMLRSGHVKEERRSRALEVIERSVQQEIRIVEELLDISTIAGEQFHVAPRPVDVCEIAREAFEQARPAATAKGISLTARGLDRAIEVNGDAKRLCQAIFNLVSNAVKFTPGGGNVSMTLDAAGSEVHLAVEDTGEGIAPDVLPRLFRRFELGDASTTRSNGGLGLGLSIAHAIVERHGGSLAAESRGPGCGSRFTVSLPLRCAAGESAPVRQPAA